MITFALALQLLLTADGAAQRGNSVSIVSIGDSYASGEGNPASGPQPWLDAACHRSATNGPALFARNLQAAHPSMAVSFTSFACSGAKIDWGVLTPQYDGYLSQIDQVVGYACARNAAGQPDCQAGVVHPIDILIVSIGGNDLAFGDLIANCLDNDTPPTVLDPSNPECPYGSTKSSLGDRIAALPGKYDQLAQAINTKLAGAVREVWLTEYLDATRRDDNASCELFRDSIGIHLSLKECIALGILEPWSLLSGCNVSFPIKITAHEASRAREALLLPLELLMRSSAARNGWTYVAGLAADAATHGLCTSNRWALTNPEALAREGANAPGAPAPGWYIPGYDGVSAGYLHPNEAGHAAYAGWMQIAFEGGLTTAAYDPALAAVACGNIGQSCTTGDLLRGRGTVGPEARAPNALGVYGDTSEGVYRVDGSIERITITSTSSPVLGPGANARIDVTIWAGLSPANEYLDVWLAPEVVNGAGRIELGTWTFVGTLRPGHAGEQVLSVGTELPAGHVQAIRARYRRSPDAALSSAASHVDNDVLVYPVSPKRGMNDTTLMTIIETLLD